MFYRSETCRRFHDEETGLYLQGNLYVLNDFLAEIGSSVYGCPLKLRTPPKYAALRLAWEAYYIVFDMLTIKTRIHHQYLLSGRGTTGTAFRHKDTPFVVI